MTFYSLNFTGPGAQISLIGDRQTIRPTLPVPSAHAEDVQRQKRIHEKNAGGRPQGSTSTKCWCGRVTADGSKTCRRHSAPKVGA
jgi:hypothetical protein